MKILRDHRVVGKLGDIQGENRAAMKCLVEINEPGMFDALGGPFEFLVMEVDEVLHHVFHRLRAGIDGIDFQPRFAHAFRHKLVQKPVIIQALRRQKIGVGGFVIRRKY